MTADKRALVHELRAACEAHGRVAYGKFPDANLAAANDRIGSARDAIDKAWSIDTAGVIGNDTILQILR